MANLVIDIGNSRTKFAVFNNSDLKEVFTDLTVKDVELLISKFQISSSILSSVRNDAEEWEAVLKPNTSFLRFSAHSNHNIQIGYKSPQTLGLDRLAAIIGAQSLFPRRNCLVIDSGTCITYDAIDAEGYYSGGSISPGLNMRFQAMHTFTGRLPLLELDENFSDWQGTDTISAMQSGVVNGGCAEVIDFIKKYDSRYPNLQIILCGGDANFFDTRLKSSIFAHTFTTEPHLVLIGLNKVIHQHNDKNF
ncbi:type III pantothenate kinase [Daejeonella oryzae]|uniref:type III pantothenate kinase n=1 Tax=Daejeonella oryzae TaxID=1122943 RepID=UPI000409E50E|nr:type III pantothenate kinase [Daejeonella oryzae]